MFTNMDLRLVSAIQIPQSMNKGSDWHINNNQWHDEIAISLLIIDYETWVSCFHTAVTCAQDRELNPNSLYVHK